MLIGAGYPAMVVSGTAKLTTTTNDQRDVVYPLPNDEPIEDNTGADDEIILSSDKYKLKPKPVLVSYLKEKLEVKRIEKERKDAADAEYRARMERETIEDDFAFNDPYRRSHAWVVIVTNAPWTTKPRIKVLDEEGEEVDAPPTVQFIEPSTGFIHETNSRAYVRIDSVWNDLNYYVNLQRCRIHEMKWDLRETSDWEHFLVAEPPEMRTAEELSDENLGEETNKIAVEKHLDMGRTWVQKLEITEQEFDERFPNQSKAIYYKRVLHERFASHVQEDGKMEQVTSYADDDYSVPKIRWTWYDNRSDLLKKTVLNFETAKNEEFFLMGRPDSLKCFIYNNDHSHSKKLYFYSMPRLDSLKYAEVGGRTVILEFERIPGRCYYKAFIAKAGIGVMAALREITEKFQRDPSKPTNKDIAIRHFLIAQNKIIVKFHYVRGALTAVTREFIKPPKPDYGQEIIFNPSITVGYKYGGSDAEPTQLEIYLLLLEQLKAEEAAKKAFDKHLDELNSIIELRRREMQKTILKFKAFDPLRNAAALKIRMEKDEEEAREKKKRRENLPDFLAPYLVPYAGRALTQKESLSAYHACLDELKTRFVSLLNELQRRYEDLTAEAQSLKKFLNKFENKFDDFDYERLVQESKDLELNKRMVQKRLTITHEEAQKKYDLVKASLLRDPRLNLKSIEILSEEDGDM